MTLEQHNKTLDERAPRLSEKEAKLIGLLEALQEKYDTLVEMAYESQRAIGKRIEYLKSLEDTP